MSCATHVADPSFQIGAGPSGPFDCTAHSCSDAIDHATCGAKDPPGRLIRGLTDEPIPSPTSPGLNLNQVAAVAWNDYGVYLEVRTGLRKVTFAEYETRRKAGQGAIIQLSYGPINDSKYDASRHLFRGGHAMFESLHATYDPLADGRYPGCYRYNGTVYDRTLMRKAAGLLAINSAGDRVGAGWVYAAFTRDVVPNYIARIPPGPYLAYRVEDNVVQYRRRRETDDDGLIGSCTAPRSYRWPGHGTVTLVRLLTGGAVGRYISARYAKETP